VAATVKPPSALTDPARRPDWTRDGANWPHREHSRFVRAGGLRWHVQRMGRGPDMLLLHGTGAATHTWRGLAPCLADRFTLVAPDLPGHGFTEALTREPPSLVGIARAVADLLDVLGAVPALVIGHSAGAAIAARMTLDRTIAPRGIVGINAALLPFSGLHRVVFRPAAQLLARHAWLPRLFARRASDRRAVERLVASTGSVLAPSGVDLYARLVSSPAHVAGALAMMANWDLDPLARELPSLDVPVLLLAGGDDRTLSPAQAELVARRLPRGRAVRLPSLGHLAHEEQPQRVAELCLRFAAETGSTDCVTQVMTR
jgi:magnesium chelatase accessory protein